VSEADALSIAAAVRGGTLSAVEVAEATLARIAARDPALNSFTAVTEARALADARAVDVALARGDDPGPLAGAPFAVKNLFDVAGLVTIAGSKIDRERPPATADATIVRRLAAAGAVLVGALNMYEYAYGSTTENTHYGPAHNPHDPARVAGGSSGGSGAAVAGGLVPLALGSDTNGSIRVPASLCGIFGLKPTYGRLSRAGARLFAASLDHVGPLARSVGDLAATYDAMQGPDPRDPACAGREVEPVLPEIERGADGLRIAGTGRIAGITADLRDVAELAPVLTAVAALAEAPSVFTGLAHTRAHETDRLAALAKEINALGGDVTELPDGLQIRPRPLRAAEPFGTYDDHRMVMAAAVLGLAVPGLRVDGADTVAKTFPDFMDVWASMLGLEP